MTIHHHHLSSDINETHHNDGRNSGALLRGRIVSLGRVALGRVALLRRVALQGVALLRRVGRVALLGRVPLLGVARLGCRVARLGRVALLGIALLLLLLRRRWFLRRKALGRVGWGSVTLGRPGVSWKHEVRICHRHLFSSRPKLDWVTSKERSCDGGDKIVSY